MSPYYLRGARPFPPLAIEVITQILSWCDQQTLGRVCRASNALLHFAGPLLYKHVTVTGYRQLERLFYLDVSVPCL